MERREVEEILADGPPVDDGLSIEARRFLAEAIAEAAREYPQGEALTAAALSGVRIGMKLERARAKRAAAHGI